MLSKNCMIYIFHSLRGTVESPCLWHPHPQPPGKSRQRLTARPKPRYLMQHRTQQLPSHHRLSSGHQNCPNRRRGRIRPHFCFQTVGQLQSHPCLQVPSWVIYWDTFFRLGHSPVQAVHSMLCTAWIGECANLKTVSQSMIHDGT